MLVHLQREDGEWDDFQLEELLEERPFNRAWGAEREEVDEYEYVGETMYGWDDRD